MNKPTTKPNNPCFSSGPCAKRPGWSLKNLEGAFLGRSHRAADGKAKLNEVCDRHRKLLGIPADYHVAIVPASDTGAVEMAMWSMLGKLPVEMVYWEAFGLDWAKDVSDQLKLDAKIHKAPYGELPDLSKVDTKNCDVVFTWNGTTSGVRAPNGDWIASDRNGIVICDATSGVFGCDMPWDKLDVTTWSWQKVLGSEAAHGMLVLSPRAVERLENYKPDRPLPKIFRMTKAGNKFADGIFKGETINTPSMLAVEDCLDALKWVESIGGVKGTIARTAANYRALKDWADKSDWVDFLCADEAVRSPTSVTLKIKDEWFTQKGDEDAQTFVKSMVKLIDKEGAGYDIASYRDAPAGLRIWCGATVEESDVKALIPWLDWAYAEAKGAEVKKAA